MLSHAGLPSTSLSYAAGAIAVVGAYLLLRFSPFPAPLRQLLPFTFFLAYQFAVVARSYVLIPPLCFALAFWMRRRSNNYVGMAIVAGLLANTSVHGCILAGCLVVGYAWMIRAEFRRKDRIAITAGTCIFVGSCLLAVISARPAPDCNFIAPQVTAWTPAAAAAAHVPWSTVLLRKMERGAATFAVPFAQSEIFVVILMGALCWLLYERRLLILLLPLPALMLFFSLVYVSFWHTGVLLVAVLTALWIAWPADSSLLVAAPWIMMSLLQITWTVHCVRFDWSHDYDGSRKASQYLAARVSGKKIFGYGPYRRPSTGISHESLFDNQPISYWVWKQRQHNRSPDWNRIASEKPDYIVVCGVAPQKASDDLAHVQDAARNAGYRIEAAFEGRMPVRDEFLEDESVRDLECAILTSVVISILLTTLHVVVCFFLIIVVLLQSGKAADLAGAFGGMGSQTAFGPRGSATLLSKATTISAILFMLASGRCQ